MQYYILLATPIGFLGIARPAVEGVMVTWSMWCEKQHAHVKMILKVEIVLITDGDRPDLEYLSLSILIQTL